MESGLEEVLFTYSVTVTVLPPSNRFRSAENLMCGQLSAPLPRLRRTAPLSLHGFGDARRDLTAARRKVGVRGRIFGGIEEEEVLCARPEGDRVIDLCDLNVADVHFGKFGDRILAPVITCHPEEFDRPARGERFKIGIEIEGERHPLADRDGCL